MGLWILCKNCKKIVPHYTRCDVCDHTLPRDEYWLSNNTLDMDSYGLCCVCGELLGKGVDVLPYGAGCQKCKTNI